MASSHSRRPDPPLARIDAGIEKGRRQDIRLTHKVPVAWTYLTGWAARDRIIDFRDDIYGLDDKPAMVAEGHAPAELVAARASGLVLQSAEAKPFAVKSVSYLDSQ